MNVRLMNRVAISVAVIAVVLAWLPYGGPPIRMVALLGLAFIVCFAALIETVHRCADALERRN
jgi:hypothetical protein